MELLKVIFSISFKSYIRGVPDYDHPYGFIRFDRSVKPISDRIADKAEPNTTENSDGLFQGAGFTLRKARK